jgi:Tfp pilus assembly protein PilF
LLSFDAAIERDPDYGVVWLNRGRVLGELGKFDEARENLDKALRLDIALKRSVTIDRALLFTASGDDNAAEEQLRLLDQWEVPTDRLRAHLAGMRAKRLSPPDPAQQSR